MEFRIIESPPTTIICEMESHSESSFSESDRETYQDLINPEYLVDGYRYAFYNRLVSNKTGYGIGGKLVDMTLDYCDTNNIVLINNINAYGDMEFEQLREFYKRHGFVEMYEPLDCGLIYYPNSREN